MKNIVMALFAVVVCILHSTMALASDEPIQHLKKADVISLEEAKNVFFRTTSELRDKKDLDSAQLHEIHMITYSLEKAVAYFAENMKGDRQAVANNMAEVVEQVHISSENNRPAETAVYLEEYFKLAKKLRLSFSLDPN